MGRLKYLANFGVSLHHIDYIKCQVYQQGKQTTYFQTFDNHQLLQVYVYTVICLSLIRKNNVQEEIKFLCVNIFHKVIQDNNHLKKLLDYNLAD